MRRSTAATRNDWQPPRPIPEGSGVTNSDGSLASVSAASNSSGNLLPAAGTASSNSDSSRPLQASINAATNGSSSNEPTGTESLSNSHSNSLPSSVALIDNNSRSLHDRASANPMSASEPMIHQGDRLLTASEVKERYYTDDSHRHTYVVVDCIRLGCMSEISSRPLHSPDWDSSAKNFKHTTGVHSRVEVESCIKVVHMGDLDKDASIFSPQNNPYETHAIDFMIPSGGVGSTKMPVSMAQGQHRLVGYVKNLSPEVARGATDLENAPRIRLTTGTVPCAIGFRNKLFVLAEVSYTTRENLVNEIIKNADLNNRGDMRVKELTFDRASTVRKVMNLVLWGEGGLMQGVFGVRGLLHKARKKKSKKFQEDPDKAAFQSVAHEMAERLAQLADEPGNSQISLNAGGTTVSTEDGSGTASRYNRAAYIKVLKRFMELALVAPRWWSGFVAAASAGEDLEAWQSFEEVAPGVDLAGALRKRKFHFQALTLESVSNTQEKSFHPGGQTFAGQGAYIMTILESGVLRGKRGASVGSQASAEDADDDDYGRDDEEGSSVDQAAERMTPAQVRKLAIARSFNANGLDRAMCMWLGVIEVPQGIEVEGKRAAYEILLLRLVLNGDGAATFDGIDYAQTDKVVDGDVVGFKGGGSAYRATGSDRNC